MTLGKEPVRRRAVPTVGAFRIEHCPCCVARAEAAEARVAELEAAKVVIEQQYSHLLAGSSDLLAANADLEAERDAALTGVELLKAALVEMQESTVEIVRHYLQPAEPTLPTATIEKVLGRIAPATEEPSDANQL